jgi:hypothetical protein
LAIDSRMQSPQSSTVVLGQVQFFRRPIRR